MTQSDAMLSVRIPSRTKAAAERQAKRDELPFSEIVRLLLKAYGSGEIDITVKVKKKR